MMSVYRAAGIKAGDKYVATTTKLDRDLKQILPSKHRPCFTRERVRRTEGDVSMAGATERLKDRMVLVLRACRVVYTN